MGAVDDATDVAVSRFRTLVELGRPVDAVYDNFRDDHPDDSEWVRVRIELVGNRVSGIRDETTIRERMAGALVAETHVPILTGRQTATALADFIADQFRGVTVSGVRFGTPATTFTGRDRSGKWWVAVTRCPFLRDEVASRST